MFNREYKKPMPRDGYAQHLKELAGNCAFCQSPERDLDIQQFEHWIWKFATFPFGKYHTILILKRHIENFSDLESSELAQLPSILKEVEQTYHISGIVGDNSRYGDELFTHWLTRSAEEEKEKKSVLHFHINFRPRFNNGHDLVSDEMAFDFDPTRLRK